MKNFFKIVGGITFIILIVLLIFKFCFWLFNNPEGDKRDYNLEMVRNGLQQKWDENAHQIIWVK